MSFRRQCARNSGKDEAENRENADPRQQLDAECPAAAYLTHEPFLVGVGKAFPCHACLDLFGKHPVEFVFAHDLSLVLFFLSSRASSIRAAYRRDLTVPIGMPVSDAISSTGRSLK